MTIAFRPGTVIDGTGGAAARALHGPRGRGPDHRVRPSGRGRSPARRGDRRRAGRDPHPGPHRSPRSSRVQRRRRARYVPYRGGRPQLRRDGPSRRGLRAPHPPGRLHDPSRRARAGRSRHRPRPRDPDAPPAGADHPRLRHRALGDRRAHGPAGLGGPRPARRGDLALRRAAGVPARGSPAGQARRRPHQDQRLRELAPPSRRSIPPGDDGRGARGGLRRGAPARAPRRGPHLGRTRSCRRRPRRGRYGRARALDRPRDGGPDGRIGDDPGADPPRQRAQLRVLARRARRLGRLVALARAVEGREVGEPRDRAPGGGRDRLRDRRGLHDPARAR